MSKISRRKSHRENGRRPAPPAPLDPKIKREIAAILMLMASLIVLLGLLGTAGQAGQVVSAALSAVFGLSRYLVPVVMVALAGHIAMPERFRLSFPGQIGLAFLLTGLSGLINLIVLKSPEAMLNPGRLSQAGGYLGLILGYPAVRLADFWGAAVILSGITVVALIVSLNVAIRDVWAGVASTVGFFRTKLGGLNPAERLLAKRAEAAATPVATPAALPEKTEGKSGEPSVSVKEDAPPVGKDDFVPNPPPKKKLPPVSIPTSLLDGHNAKPTAGDIGGRMLTIRKTLENFGIPVEMGEVSVGPTVTQFTLKPADGIKLSRLTSLSNDLAMSLAAHPIRIEAPIPGKPLVGIEVPNQGVAVVGLREILESPEFRNARKSSLTICLGKDVSGHPWVADLGKMPHMLVAGATGSGKTVCLNAIILSLLFQNSPEDLRLLLIDPKRVELPVYNGIPHMLVPAVTEVPKIINALKWCIEEMDRRFIRLSEVGCRDIGSYNARPGTAERMPYIVVVIDELADLMVASASEVEGSIIRLAQMARAVGIHLVIATQRPSVDVITGLIKANVTSRIAFSVASSTDSRTILDTMGAEKLVGRGDSLFQTPEYSRPRRIQCCFVGDAEIRKVVDHIVSRTEEPIDYIADITERKGGSQAVAGGDGDGDDDELLEEAKMTVVKAGKASASYLQRRLKVGYARAARLLDLLEEQGVIGPGDGAKPRQVLIDPVIDEDGYHLPERED